MMMRFEANQSQLHRNNLRIGFVLLLLVSIFTCNCAAASASASSVAVAVGATTLETVSPTSHHNNDSSTITNSPTVTPTRLHTLAPTDNHTTTVAPTPSLANVTTLAPTSSSPSSVVTSAPTTAFPSVAPTPPPPTASPSLSPVTTEAPSASPTSPPSSAPPPPPPPPTPPKRRVSIWRILGKTLGWLILIALSVLLFGAIMSNRYQIYYFFMATLRRIRRMECTRWILQKTRLSRLFGGGGGGLDESGGSLNDVIFDRGDLTEGLLMTGEDQS